MFSMTPWKKSSGGSSLPAHPSAPESHPIARMQQEFDDLLSRFWDDWGRGTSLAGDRWTPRLATQLQDEEKEYVLRAELPGFEAEDFDLKVSGNVLTLRAERKDEKQEEGSSYHRQSSYSETFTLPSGVEADQIDARYHSGVLEVHLPKNETCHTKRISVKAN